MPNVVQVDGPVSPQSLHNYQSLSATYSVSSRACLTPFLPLPRQRVLLKTEMRGMGETVLDERNNWTISLKSASHISTSKNSLHSFFVHFNYSTPTNNQTATPLTEFLNNGTLYLQIKVQLPSDLSIISVAGMCPAVWGLRIETDPSNLTSTTFVLWLNEVAGVGKGWEGVLFGVVVKGTPSLGPSETTSPTTTNLFGNLFQGEGKGRAEIGWSIQSAVVSNEVTNQTEVVGLVGNAKKRQVTTFLQVKEDTMEEVVVVTGGDDLVNTAVLSNTQISRWMKVYGVFGSSRFVELREGLSCESGQSRVLKSSPSCTMVYVDGSEVGGVGNVEVKATFKGLVGIAKFTVWYPDFPVTIWLEKPVLNAISEWTVAVWKWLSKREAKANERGRREARTFGCRERFQQTEIKILTSFQYMNEKNGEKMYLLPNKLLDITPFLLTKIHVENGTLAELKKIHSRLILSGKKAGTTKMVYTKDQLKMDLGSKEVMISENRISINELWIEPVVNIQLQIEATETNNIFKVLKIIKNEFEHRYERGVLDISLKMSDGQIVSLFDINSHDYLMTITSNDNERLLAINKKSPHIVPELIALSDLTDVQVKVEIKSPESCKGIDNPALITSQALVPIYFPIEDSNRMGVDLIGNEEEDSLDQSPLPFKPDAIEKEAEMEVSKPIKTFHPFLVLIFVILALVLIVQIINCNGNRLHDGYEKLVAPFIAKLNSNSSLTNQNDKHEDSSKEWIWLSRKESKPNLSFGSQYSNKSTVSIREPNSEEPSPEEGINRSISVSYKGSEVSVFISPNASVLIPERSLDQHLQYTSWRTGRRNGGERGHFGEMDTSNSETNLKRWNTESRPVDEMSSRARASYTYQYKQPDDKVIAAWRESKRRGAKLALYNCIEESSISTPVYDSEEELLLARPLRTADAVSKYLGESSSCANYDVLSRDRISPNTSLKNHPRLGNNRRLPDRRSAHFS
uniref:TMEM132 domain-containing protein n=1 Tax=Rhabditophanes sp. KR3021 TaxID=114890 RepID=A0AC35THT8_9BILA